jgi:hypothetical protein
MFIDLHFSVTFERQMLANIALIGFSRDEQQGATYVKAVESYI